MLEPEESTQTGNFAESDAHFEVSGEVLLAPRPTPKLEDHPLSVDIDCLFISFAAGIGGEWG
jgi:hypothetical protein